MALKIRENITPRGDGNYLKKPFYPKLYNYL